MPTKSKQPQNKTAPPAPGNDIIMPELPEVEVTRRAITPALLGKTVSDVVARTPSLRYPIPAELSRLLIGRRLLEIRRRGKYLLLDFGNGMLLLHLGMSGSLRLLVAGTAPQKHDHLDVVFGPTLLRLRDPRRFGAVLWLPANIDPAAHPLLATLGMEPLDAAFDTDWLWAATRGRSSAIKPLLMNNQLIVGVGNIYASESLFRAGIDPRTPAGRISRPRLSRLIETIRSTLTAAIDAGGSSLRDFTHTDGSAGYFQQQYFVYGRTGEPCRICQRSIVSLRQGQRTTFFCPGCQHR
jgi:formamidopyrimidine-DNA glycosylase